ncbi:toxin glutamine deamidase domain-containing protein [Nonomuraea sp. NPDC048882]|uniref:toxin glutamine deamidase domain-containing protein n=1 Tax=Nonomuraea sp. NPDC048882 TaxID=3154347 RepID=UPI0033DBDF32
MSALRSFVEHDRRQAVFRERKPSVPRALPGVAYNPIVADGVRWLDYERAAEPVPDDHDPASGDHHSGPEDRRSGARECRSGARRCRSEPHECRPGSHECRPEGGEGPHVLELPEYDWFDLPHRPPSLARSRPYGVPGGLAEPDPQVERDLADALRPGARFPDPRGTWVRLVNGSGPADDPFRASNAADCALAVLSTWHGEPATAAPRLPEYDRIGRPALTGERGSVARIERWVGHRLQYAGQGRHAYPMIERRLLDADHGAAAVIVVRWPGGGSHAWNAVNFDGEVIWIDAQRGHMSVEPPYRTVTGVFCVILDRGGRPR